MKSNGNIGKMRILKSVLRSPIPVTAVIFAALLVTGCSSAVVESGKHVWNNLKRDFKETFGDPVDPKEFHLYNFDTFVCDGTRQVVVSFNPDGSRASILFDDRQKLLTRTTPAYPFTDGIYDLYIMPDGTLYIEKNLSVLFKHCRPLVSDPAMAEALGASVLGPPAPYKYTPTIDPMEAKADMIFREHLRK
jgi:hypothetical protein